MANNQTSSPIFVSASSISASVPSVSDVQRLEKKLEKMSMVLSKMTQHYADNLVKNPDSFKTGLGKNVSGRKRKNPPKKEVQREEKRWKVKPDKPSKFMKSVTQGPSTGDLERELDAFTQGPVEWIMAKLAIVKDGVDETLRAPALELVDYLRDEDVAESLRTIADTARGGQFKILFGLDKDTLIPAGLLIFILCLPFLTRSQICAAIVLISLFATFSVGSDFFWSTLETIKSFVSFGNPVTQAPLDFTSCYRFAISCFSVWNMRSRYGEDATTFEKIHSLAKSFKIQSVKASDLIESVGLFQELLKDALEFVNSLFGLSLDTSAFQGETWFEVERLNKQFLELKEKYDKRENLHSVASQMVTLEAYGMSLINRFKAGGPAYTQYRDAMYRIVALREELSKLGVFGNSTRQEPLFVLIGGQAGVGKSTVSTLIQAAMVKESCGGDAVKRFNAGDSGAYVYVPEQESKFLDGYNNQTICLLDDFASSVESVQVWASKLIHLVNTQACQTLQASLERKGAVYFDSKFILGTTNVTVYSGVLQNMYSKEAVSRRIHLTLKCKVKPEFASEVGTGGDPTQDPVLVAAYREANPDCDECFWLDWYWFDALSGAEQPMCACGKTCTAVEACRRATFGDILSLIIRTYRHRVEYQVKEKARLRRVMDFLESDEDTLTAIGNAFTQSSCGNEACFACSSSRQERMGILQTLINNHHFNFQDGQGSDPEFIGIDNEETRENAMARDMERMRNMVTNRDVAKNFFGIAGAFTPVCIKELAKGHNFVQKHAAFDFTEEYLHRCKLWCSMTQVSAVANARSELTYFIHDIRMASVHEKLLIFASTIANIALFYGAFKLTSRAIEGFKSSVLHQKKKKKPSAVVQSADSQHDQVVKSLLGSNILYMQDEDSFCGYALGIGGTLVVLNKHVYHAIIKDHTQISFLKKTSKKNRFAYTVRTDSLKAFESDHDDLVCVNVVGFHCQNIVHHIADEDVKATPSFNVQLTHWSPDNDGVAVESASGLARLGRPVAALSPEGKEYISVNTVEYDIPTENGQCGALLTRVDATRKSKVVGLHAAGSRTGDQGYGILITKGFISRCFSHFSVPIIQYSATSDVDTHFSFCSAPKTVLDDVQVCGAGTSVSTTYKSEITKSPLYDQIADPPQKKPALLNPFRKNGELFDPVAESLKSYSRGGVLCNMDVLNAATSAYIHELTCETVKPVHAVLSFEETVMGSKTKAEFLKPINRGTASGSPSRFNPSVGTKKREAFGYDEDYTMDTPGALHIRDQYDQALKALEDGPIPMIFTAFPKDELRPSEKVAAGKTRVVFSCDVVNTLLIRKYFGAFASWYQDPKNRFKNSSAVGMNVADQFECRTFAEKLGNGSLTCDVKAGDYSGFDKTLPSYVIDSVWKVYEAFFGPLMTPTELKIAKNIFISFTKPYIQYKDCVIEWDNSNPSGNPITTILNTICNNVVLRYGVARSLGCFSFKDSLKTLKDLYADRIVEYVCYGDDNAWKVDVQKLKKYGSAIITYASMAEALLEMGLVYTDEVKSDHFDEERRTVFDISFLKRTLECREGIYFMKLSLDTLTQNIQWQKKKDVDGELYRVKCEGFLDELSAHDQATWDFWFTEFYSAAKRVDPRRNLMVQWGRSKEDRVSDFLARGCEYW